jgi:prolipoprotein diacylglyceryltransferase
MYELLVEFCRWIQSTSWAQSILTSSWAFPYVQLTHFTGLSLWIGTNALLDLRLLGVGKKHQTASQLSDALFVWNWIGFGIAVFGGFLLFSISATIYIRNPAFRIKLGVLIPLALLLHIVVQRKARAWDQEDTPVAAKLAGLAELTLWFCVASAAVLIPYFFGPADLP